MMDAASILPVVALDLEPGCSVLDLCAAPGGKTLAMIQTALPGRLVCIDHSYKRLVRLRSILKDYLPSSYLQHGGAAQVIHTDGNIYCKDSDPTELFDRVLVDVPCFTDRHVLHEDHNNIFRPGRINDRLNIQNLQKNLLFNGIKKCRPGGSIVYSTCTLSPPQNDGVIQATLEKLWQETNINVTVQDLSAIKDRFRESFYFYKDCRFGQLVVPHLMANFGPMYFCKLNRLN